MNLWLDVWRFSRLLVIFTDFSPEKSERIAQFLAISTNLSPGRDERIYCPICVYFHEFES